MSGNAADDGPAEEAIRCSFCQKNLEHVAHLIQSPRANICDECVQLSLEVLIEARVFPRLRLLSLLFR